MRKLSRKFAAVLKTEDERLPPIVASRAVTRQPDIFDRPDNVDFNTWTDSRYADRLKKPHDDIKYHKWLSEASGETERC